VVEVLRVLLLAQALQQHQQLPPTPTANPSSMTSSGSSSGSSSIIWVKLPSRWGLLEACKGTVALMQQCSQ
jgi:hypothetical protein